MGGSFFFSFPVRCDMIKCDTYYGRRIANCILLWEGGVFFDTILYSNISTFEVWSERVKILIVNTLYNA